MIKAVISWSLWVIWSTKAQTVLRYSVAGSVQFPFPHLSYLKLSFLNWSQQYLSLLTPFRLESCSQIPLQVVQIAMRTGACVVRGNHDDKALAAYRKGHSHNRSFQVQSALEADVVSCFCGKAQSLAVLPSCNCFLHARTCCCCICCLFFSPELLSLHPDAWKLAWRCNRI